MLGIQVAFNHNSFLLKGNTWIHVEEFGPHPAARKALRYHTNFLPCAVLSNSFHQPEWTWGVSLLNST